MDLTDFPAFRYDIPDEKGIYIPLPVDGIFMKLGSGSRRWFLIRSRPVAALANLARFANDDDRVWSVKKNMFVVAAFGCVVKGWWVFFAPQCTITCFSSKSRETEDVANNIYYSWECMTSLSTKPWYHYWESWFLFFLFVVWNDRAVMAVMAG